jgi:hypothetical protein
LPLPDRLRSGNVQKTKRKFSFDSCGLRSNQRNSFHCALEVIEMSTKAATLQYRPTIPLLIALIALLACASSWADGGAPGNESSAGEMRTSESLHYRMGGRANERDPAKGSLSVDEFGPLELAGKRSRVDGKPSGNEEGVMAQSGSFDFWFYDADVILFNDDDHDGYYFGIDLLFDADTIYGSADVYAAVYLSYEGGPWNEYAVTDDFRLYGASSDDEFVLVTELMSGYPSGDYDLLIELFDAYDGAFLASFGPEDTSELGYLPLEDFNRDAPPRETRVVVSRGGGGGTGLMALLALSLALAGRRVVRRRVLR